MVDACPPTVSSIAAVMMAPYIPAARRRPVFSAAGPSSAASPAAILVMAAPSGQYTPAGTDYPVAVPRYEMAITRPQLGYSGLPPDAMFTVYVRRAAR